jgi:cell division protein FtsB
MLQQTEKETGGRLGEVFFLLLLSFFFYTARFFRVLMTRRYKIKQDEARRCIQQRQELS